MYTISAIFAADAKGGMGQAGRMPWPSLTEDLRMFRHRTLNNIIIMGRKTWESVDMRNPLPHRTSAVWTTQDADQLPLPQDVIRCSGPPTGCLALMNNLTDTAATILRYKHSYVIGGAETLRAWMPLCSTVYYTEIEKTYPCDTVFAPSEWQTDFDMQNCTTHTQGDLTYHMSMWCRKY